jgi:hypothetical protein
MDSRLERPINIAVGAAALVWAASFVVSFFALGLAALNAGLLQIELFGSPRQLPWVMPAITGSSIVVSSIIASLVFRFLRNKIQFHQ